MTLTSRFHSLNAILIPIFFVLLFATLGYMVGYLSFMEVESGRADSIYKTPIYGSLILAAMAVGTILHYIKILKKVRISNHGIKSQSLFKSEFIPWESMKKIELMGKIGGFSSPQEATILGLRDGRKLEIIASLYQNMAALRKTLEQVAESLENLRPVEIGPVSETPITKSIKHLDLNRMSKFSGKHFLSLNGASIYVWIAFSIYWGFANYPDFFGFTLLFQTLIFGVFYGFLGNQLHYFYLDKDYLVVKNHVWPWVHDVYRIDEIRQVVFEIPYRRSLSMRVITEDYQSRLYPAGSLRKNQWKALLKQLQDLGLDIRNETLLEQPISSDSRI